MVSTSQRTCNLPARKKRISSLDRCDLFFKEIPSYLPARNKYMLCSAQRNARSVWVCSKVVLSEVEPYNRQFRRKQADTTTQLAQPIRWKFKLLYIRLIPFPYFIYKKIFIPHFNYWATYTCISQFMCKHVFVTQQISINVVWKNVVSRSAHSIPIMPCGKSLSLDISLFVYTCVQCNLWSKYPERV
jgi:hypothetical protein